MSDTPSTPIPTATIAAEILADSEMDQGGAQGDTDGGGSDSIDLSASGDSTVEGHETPAIETVATPLAEAIAAPVATTPDPVQDAIDKEMGFKPLAPGEKRNGRIPYDRVTKIVGNAVAKTKGELEAVTGKVTQYESRLNEVAQVEHIMLNDPQRFLEMLATLPAYQALGKASSAPGNGAAAPTDMPQPNVDLADGTKTYNIEGLQKLMDWQAGQVEKRVASRYGPLEQQYKTQQLQAQLLPKIQAQVSEAEKWPLFKESVPDIMAVIQRNPGTPLADAYRQVVLPKFQTSRDAMRADLLKELNSKPSSTSLPNSGGSGSPSANTGPRSTESIAREIIARANKG